MAHFLFTALGTYGDVHPTIGLGMALMARGHRATIIANSYFEDIVTAAGIGFVPMGTSESYLEWSAHPDMWHPTRSTKFCMRKSAEQLRELFNLLMANYVPGETVFCPHMADAASHLAAEKLDAPVANIVLAPAILWSVHSSPRVMGTHLGKRVPKWLKRFQYWIADRFYVSRIMGPEINVLRRELGLEPLRKVLNFALYDADLVLGLFPDWYAPRQPDWPANTVLAGFPLWDAQENAQLSDEVQSFLNAGTPPITFCPGSGFHDGQDFFAAAAEACQRLGRRGIFLTKYADQIPKNLPASVRHFGFVPLSRLLPKSAAFVHHGGIGSSSQALVAGIPQIVRPLVFDQYDNARRVRRLGVGKELWPRQFTARNLTRTLDSLLSSPEVAARCRELAPRSDGHAALTIACDALESIAPQAAARSTAALAPAYI